MKINIKDIFWVPEGKVKKNLNLLTIKSAKGYDTFHKLTKGKSDKPLDEYKGISFYKKVNGRRPAISLFTNPFKENTPQNPWVDVINLEGGWLLFNGDNKTSKLKAEESRGNKVMIEAFKLYNSREKEQRMMAPPLLVFSQENVRGKMTGYRSFQGYGIIKDINYRTQYEKEGKGIFTNLVFLIYFFNLERENNQFDWEWIDQRRDGTLSSKDALAKAPLSWKKWVDKGETIIDSCRGKIHSHQIIPRRVQQGLTIKEEKIIESVLSYYSEKKHHKFEGLASLIAKRILGNRYTQGWITPRTGDEGIDFVGRLDLGEDMSRASLVVAGEAKCKKEKIDAKDLDRLAAKLQRGWIGIFITTGYYSIGAQKELLKDKYPIILVSGKELANHLLRLTNEQNTTLKDILKETEKWYDEHIRWEDPSLILHGISGR